MFDPFAQILIAWAYLAVIAVGAVAFAANLHKTNDGRR